jgi:peptide methionine sulfoxide reductase msrA/msrB
MKTISTTTSTLVFAGGCFWCVEHDLRQAPGVLEVISGYAGNTALGNIPMYYAHTGYREAVQVTYDTTKTSYKKLLQFFIDHIDPTDDGGQFHDRGASYKTAIYFSSEDEQKIAQNVLEELDASHIYDQPHAIEVLPYEAFYLAEAEHQNYAENNPTQYAAYRKGSGREDFVNKTCQIREEKHIAWKE